MKGKYITAILLLVILVLITLCVLPSIRINIKYARLRPQQEELAKEFGVNIQDYRYEAGFPEGYFGSILKPGMTLDEVHAIVKGYEEVYQCFGFAELYYYFSNEGEKAVVFMLSYDDNNKFVDMRSMDEDISNTSRSSGGGPEACSSPGLLGE